MLEHSLQIENRRPSQLVSEFCWALDREYTDMGRTLEMDAKNETFEYSWFLEGSFLKLRRASVAKTGSDLCFSENLRARYARGHVMIKCIPGYDKTFLHLVQARGQLVMIKMQGYEKPHLTVD